MELVQWGDEHFEHLLRWATDPRMTRYVGDGQPWTPEYVTERHEQALRHWEGYGFGMHAVVEDGEVIGIGQMLEGDLGEIEIGYWVDPGHWGRGVATRIAEELRDKALAIADRVVAGHEAENTASGRVLEKAGLTYFTSKNMGGRLQHCYALERGMSDTGVLRYSAFTKDPAGGNPAGVVLDATGLSDDEMLAIAAKVGYSETAFVLPREGREFDVRYFSPKAEVPFCGHATIATAVALAERIGDGALTFHTPAGEITIETADGTASLTSVPTSTSEADPELVSAALEALRYKEIGDGPVHVGFGGARHLLIPLKDREQLANLDYDFDALRDLMLAHDLTTVHLFWRESADLVHARDPFPVGGVVEDAATGAAAAAFGGYLRDLEGPQRFVISQGEDMGRPSRLEVDATREDRRVTVTGAAVVIP
ncbi:PhzF family phenazine biosynthesis protein [Lentzea atacamensis]|uniref:PhzF family phenazine biosynthesis protein n=1 Tax=Lentzea atacamensis TaxID=531938 RepID=A0A316IEH8_9PSEU|nr:PhzF family phenazine biosynthesis isomerase [Lentzea atacamensis]PWK91353.1 PhzF family phenazine biosynthesis protein [Lentzea atacamensis]